MFLSFILAATEEENTSQILDILHAAQLRNASTLHLKESGKRDIVIPPLLQSKRACSLNLPLRRD